MSEQEKYPIRYSQCWEDAELLLKALDINRSDTVVSIVSGGCNTLSLLSQNPAKIFAVDRNDAQIYILELKYKALLLDDKISNFLGIDNSADRISLFHKISSELSSSCRDFWNEHPQLLEKGIMHSGKFENYLRIFRKQILPLIHSKKRIEELLNLEKGEFQQQFYHKKWNTLRWRLMFNFFFGNKMMPRYGRSEEMFTFNESENIGKIYFKRTERALLKGNLNKNRYLEYILTGNQRKNGPHYLMPEIREGIKNAESPILCHDSLFNFLESQPDNSVSKFNLSDVFESLNPIDTALIFHEIFRVATPDARIIFWNNLVHRDVPDELTSRFKRETEIIEQLAREDKVFFYADFKIYTVKK